MGKVRIAALAIAALGTAGGSLGDAVAAPAAASALPALALSASDLSAQRRRVRPMRINVGTGPIRRSATRIDVYPRPYLYEYPGPNAKRDCVSWLEPEWRPSGTVIVPRLRCRWVPG
jgi:hypothetical protein